jgi:hypothetical protein
MDSRTASYSNGISPVSYRRILTNELESSVFKEKSRQETGWGTAQIPTQVINAIVRSDVTAISRGLVGEA